MSSEAAPISPARFAEALKDLPLSTLHLKAAEIRNSIAHLDYSNEQLKPFADGTEPSCNGRPDADCQDAIKENEIVIERMKGRIELLKNEVEGRGCSWTEFRDAEELKEAEGDEALVNGTSGGGETEDVDMNMNGRGERSAAWRDGTFQTGRIVNGEVRMDRQANVNGTASETVNGTTTNSAGGRLDDQALRRAMEERLRALEEDDEEGMHL